MRLMKWKGFLTGIAALALVAGTVAPSPAATCGDANNNGGLDAGDGALLLQFVAGLNPGTGLCGGAGVLNCLDLNNDGNVDVSDLVILLNLVAGNPTIFQCTGTGTTLACGSNIQGNVNSNIKLSACTYTVDGTVLVQPNVVISIDPGATIKGKKASFNASPSVLVFLRDSKINAPGTAASPIIFTSDQAPGSRGIGDWGGVVLNGRAPVNCPGGSCAAEGLTGIQFGGNRPNDSSGIITFARLEFSGIELSPDNELNIFTQNGVGRGTVLNHIQANHGFDDCIEWFGGTVNEKYLVSSSCGDDMLDWQLGYTGSVQYALAIQNSNNTDTNGRHGFEGDNNENGFGFSPRSNPKFCNVTLVGTKTQGGTPGQAGRRGALLRRGTGGKISNVIITDFTESGIRIDNPETTAQACDNTTTLHPDSAGSPSLSVRNTILFDNGPAAPGNVEIQVAASSNCNAAQLLGLWNTNNNVQPAGVNDLGPDPLINRAYPVVSNTTNYIPSTPGPADGGVSTGCGSLDPAWMDDVHYIGAFQPGNTTPGDAGNWLDQGTGWISFVTN